MCNAALQPGLAAVFGLRMRGEIVTQPAPARSQIPSPDGVMGIHCTQGGSDGLGDRTLAGLIMI